MKYFIYKEGQLLEVAEEDYVDWEQHEMPKSFLPDYERKIGDFLFSLDTIFVGQFDEDEDPLPFILIYFWDDLSVHDEGVARRVKDEKIEYFASLEELVSRRKELIQQVEEGKMFA